MSKHIDFGANMRLGIDASLSGDSEKGGPVSWDMPRAMYFMYTFMDRRCTRFFSSSMIQ